MRRVSAGEASQFDGVLHKGLPLRVLNNKNNNLLLKDSARARPNLDPPDEEEYTGDGPYDDEDWLAQQRAEQGEGEEPEGGEIIDAVKGILEEAYDSLDDLAGGIATNPERGGPEAAGPAMEAMEKLRSMIDMLEE